MLTWDLPLNTGFNASSALIMRRFTESWRPFFLMYAQSFFTTSVRGISLLPTTPASTVSGVNGFMNDALGLRADFAFAGFFAAAFFFLAIKLTPGLGPTGPRRLSGAAELCTKGRRGNSKKWDGALE